MKFSGVVLAATASCVSISEELLMCPVHMTDIENLVPTAHL